MNGRPLIVAMIAGSAVGGAALVPALLGPPSRRPRSVDRRLLGQVVVALDTVAGALRSGASSLEAVRGAAESHGSFASDLRHVVALVEQGEPFAGAIEVLHEHHRGDAIELAVAGLGLSLETGSLRADAVTALAGSLRDQLAAATLVRSLSAQARVSCLVLTVCPIVFAFALAGTDPRAQAFLVDTPTGHACLVAGIALNGCASWWMVRLTRRASRL